jgi:hypothetical protein
VNVEYGGVPDVCRQIFPERHFHSLLAGLDVIGFRDAGVPVMIAVVADEVHDRRPGDGRREHRGVRRQKCGVESAP